MGSEMAYRTRKIRIGDVTIGGPCGAASFITLLISFTMRTGPPISLRLTFPLKICPRLLLDGSPVKIIYMRNSLEYETEVVPLISESYSLGFTYNFIGSSLSIYSNPSR